MLKFLLLLISVLFLSCTMQNSIENYEVSGFRYVDAVYLPGSSDLLLLRNQFRELHFEDKAGIATHSEIWSIVHIKESGDTIEFPLLSDDDYHYFRYISGNDSTIFLLDEGSEKKCYQFNYRTEELTTINLPFPIGEYNYSNYIETTNYLTIHERDSLLLITNDNNFYRVNRSTAQLVSQDRYAGFYNFRMPFYHNGAADTVPFLSEDTLAQLTISAETGKVLNRITFIDNAQSQYRSEPFRRYFTTDINKLILVAGNGRSFHSIDLVDSSRRTVVMPPDDSKLCAINDAGNQGVLIKDDSLILRRSFSND